MISVEDFRIGNKVQVKYSDGEHTIESIIKDDSFSGGYSFVMQNGDKVGLDYLVPIPLTDELLLKSGFKLSDNYVWEYKDNSDLLFDAPNDWYNIDSTYPIGIFSIVPGYPALYIPHGEVIIRCLYLHDLQNNFFAITGKELDVKEGL